MKRPPGEADQLAMSVERIQTLTNELLRLHRVSAKGSSRRTAELARTIRQEIELARSALLRFHQRADQPQSHED